MVADENKTQRAEVSTALPDKKKLYEKLYSVIEENQKKGTKAFVSIAVSLFGIYQHELYKEQNYANIYDFALEQFGLSKTNVFNYLNIVKNFGMKDEKGSPTAATPAAKAAAVTPAGAISRWIIPQINQLGHAAV